MDRQVLITKQIDTPLGPFLAGAMDSAVCLLEFTDSDRVELQLASVCRSLNAVAQPGDHPLLEALAFELGEYFNGARCAFSVPLRPPGSAFQQAVWNALRAVPYGETRSYTQVAVMLGAPRASRAVGAANGRNPISILIPCHRLVGSDGSLTGYGGGLWRKQRLLDLEREWQSKTAG